MMRTGAERSSTARGHVRWKRGIALAAGLGLLIAGCGGGDGGGSNGDQAAGNGSDDSDSGEEWPTDQIRILVGAAEGGGLDTLARILQGSVSNELGVDVVVENHEGAQSTIANTIAFNEGDECDVLVHNNFPLINFGWHINDVDFDLDDMYPVAATQNQPSVIVVPGDSEYEVFDDLIDAARERPGELTASVSAISTTNAVGIMQIEDELGVDVNIIDFDGGGPARTAVISGEVDFSHTSVFAAMPLLEGGELRVLGAHQTPEDWEPFRAIDSLADVETLSEITGNDAFGSNTATYGMTVNQTCADDFPERYDTLVDAFATVMASDEYLAQLEDLELDLSVLDFTPDEYYDSLVAQNEEVDAIAPDLFG